MVTWYWSADNLFWQVSIDHGRDVQYERSTRSLSQPIFWSMAAMLRDSVVVRTRPRAIPLAMITIRKILHGFPFLSHNDYGAPLGGPSGRRSSATTHFACATLVIVRTVVTGLSADTIWTTRLFQRCVAVTVVSTVCSASDRKELDKEEKKTNNFRLWRHVPR